METILSKCPRCNELESVTSFKMMMVNTSLCTNCGFQTNQGMSNGSDLEKSIFDTQPELFKDLKFVDETGFVWYPTVINEKNKAMLFPDGNNKDDWGWRVAQLVPIPVDDNIKIKNQTHKLDLHNSTLFPNHNFLAALYLYENLLEE